MQEEPNAFHYNIQKKLVLRIRIRHMWGSSISQDAWISILRL